jgi:Protein of unknown function (DUF5818)
LHALTLSPLVTPFWFNCGFGPWFAAEQVKKDTHISQEVEMRTINRLKLLGTLVLFLAAMTLPLCAQGQQGTPQEPQTPGAQSQQQEQPQGQTFAGKIVRSKGALMLEDQASKTAYKLDHEAQLKRYVGQNVKVIGTLDSSTNTIHVSNIEITSSPQY